MGITLNLLPFGHHCAQSIGYGEHSLTRRLQKSKRTRHNFEVKLD